MNARRYYAEYCIHENIRELGLYANALDRVVQAFESLDEEADKLRDEALQRASASSCNPEFDDEAYIYEWAESVAAGFYCSVNAVMQGVFNLMVAGLYHLFEQHAARLLDTNRLPPSRAQLTSQYHGKRLREYLEGLGIKVTGFRSWEMMEELESVANATKHGEGRSVEALKKRNPALFTDRYPSGAPKAPTSLPVLPLTGQGLYLSKDDFNRYRSALVQFWTELAGALLPICGPEQ